jgi:hypothetical protein
MPIFNSKPRSWEAYLAGIGASGALMASVSVMFVILVGVVTFNAWPDAGELIGGGVTLGGTASSGPSQSTAPSLIKLLGSRTGPATRHQGGGRGLAPGSVRNGLSGTGNGGTNGLSGGSGGGEPQGAQPPSASSQPRSVISQVVSGAGDTVQQTTDTLGSDLGGSTSRGLGGVLGGVGRTLNTDLQSLAGDQSAGQPAGS